MERLKVNGFIIKLNKCLWGCSAFEFLGYEVGKGQLSIPEARVELFRTYARPRTKKQLRSFLGLCGYYRKFVPMFADLTKCLTSSLTMTAPNMVVWNDDMIKSFTCIINSICNFTIILSIPMRGDLFCVVCDASSYGVGGALCVYRDNKELPISFYSCQLSNRERKFSATELEALALIETIKHFAFYLFGQHFVVHTDHRALEQLFSSPKLNNRLWRWRLYLMDFDFVIRYRPGPDNTLADALSRQGWNAAD